MAYPATYGGPRSERRFSETADVSLWRPLHQTAFLGLFVAAFVSNIGTWIQNVAAARPLLFSESDGVRRRDASATPEFRVFSVVPLRFQGNIAKPRSASRRRRSTQATRLQAEVCATKVRRASGSVDRCAVRHRGFVRRSREIFACCAGRSRCG